MELRGRADDGQHRVAGRRCEQHLEHVRVARLCAIVRSMIGEGGLCTPSAASRSRKVASGDAVSMPCMPSRSTTLAAPPPVVVTTATRAGVRAGPGGLAARQERPDLDQRFQHVHAHDAAIAEIRVQRRVLAGERAGVRAREASPRLRAPELVGDHRLARRVRRARRRARARRVAHRLQEQQDDVACRGVVGEQLAPARRRRGRASLPTETSLANPRPRAAPRDSTVPSMVPLCETMLVVPAGSDVHLEHRVHGERAAAAGMSIMPMLFGPSSRTPSARARATSRCLCAPRPRRRRRRSRR